MLLLSIIVTVYNLENYIEECLNSVLEQEFDDYEIVLVDNCSTDKSQEICEAYARKYSQINYIRLEGKSIIGRSNWVGLVAAKGEYVHMLDGDDYVATGCYPDIMEIIRNKQPDVIFGSFECRPESGAKYLKDAVIDADKINNNRSYQDILTYLMTLPSFHMVHWRYVFKKSVFFMDWQKSYAKKYRSTYKGDEANSTQILVRARTIYYYNKPFYYYRSRARGSITSTITPKHFKDYLAAVLALFELLAKTPMDDIQFDEIRRTFIFSRAVALFRLFSSGVDMLNHQEITGLSKLLEHKAEYFVYLEEMKQPETEIFCRFIKQYGNYQGLWLYSAYIRSTTLARLQGQKAKDFYVFPTGYAAEATARILKSAGLNVRGFLDNDPHKDGIVVMGLPCWLPTGLTEIGGDFKNILVVIAIINDKIKPVLKEQLLGMGLSEDQIV